MKPCLRRHNAQVIQSVRIALRDLTDQIAGGFIGRQLSPSDVIDEMASQHGWTEEMQKVLDSVPKYRFRMFLWNVRHISVAARVAHAAQYNIETLRYYERRA